MFQNLGLIQSLLKAAIVLDISGFRIPVIFAGSLDHLVWNVILC